MKEIGMDLHIKAINALIMSRQLGGKGVTLGVLAKDVREISKESNEFVSGIVNIIGSINGLAEELICTSSKNVHDSCNEKEQEKPYGNGVLLISQLHDRFLENTAIALEHSVVMKNEISRVKSNLGFLDVMKLNLEGCLSEMEKIAGRLRPFSSDKIVETAELDKVRQRYTMHVERGIHHKTVGSKPVQQDKAIKGFLRHDKNELGDNVELF
jgi:hypothetical protein